MTKSSVGRESHWPTLRGILASALCVCGLVLVVTAGRAMACYPVAIGCADCSNPSSNNLYWSGTSGLARGVYNAGDGAVLTRVKYKIETRTLFDKTSGLGGQYYTPPWYALSTTQWQCGTKMDFTAECWNNYDRYFKHYYWKYNDNWLYGYYNQSLHASAADCCQEATEVCDACNHFGSAYNQHSKYLILQKIIHECQVFYACTHCNGSTFQDSYGSAITPSEVATELSKRTADDPGLNLVFLDACYSVTQTLYNGLRGGTPSTVQCYLGWNGWVPDWERSSNWTMVFWDELGKQKTVQDAAQEAFRQYSLPSQLMVFGSAGGYYRLHLTFG